MLNLHTVGCLISDLEETFQKGYRRKRGHSHTLQIKRDPKMINLQWVSKRKLRSLRLKDIVPSQKTNGKNEFSLFL